MSWLRFLVPPPIACGDAPVSPKKAPAGIFVAVGYGGRRMSSRDGIHWENVQQWDDRSKDDSNNLCSLVYGKGKFVAVGGGGALKDAPQVGGHILVSSDGAHWRETKTMRFRISPILFAAGRFVAGGPGNQLLWSLDAESWSEGAKFQPPREMRNWNFFFRRGIAGNDTFIFAGNAGPDQKPGGASPPMTAKRSTVSTPISRQSAA